jgi:hypothetical protein
MAIHLLETCLKYANTRALSAQAKNNLASSHQRAAIPGARHADNPDCRQPPNAEEASTVIQREGSHE